MEMNEREADIYTNIKRLTQELLSKCSECNPDVVAQAIADALIEEHRTIQQCFIRALVGGLMTYSKESGTDLRNNASIQWACQATKDAGPFPYI